MDLPVFNVSPYIYIYIYIHVYIYICMHAYIYIWTNIEHWQIDFYIPRPTNACMHTCIHTYLLLLISMLWHRQAIFESKRDKLSSSGECRIRTQRVSETQSSADWMPADKPTELSRIKLKTWTQQPVPMISKHSAHLTPLPFGIRTWLWRYTYLLLLISMLWHRQAIFESKRDNGFESQLRNGYLLKCDCRFDCIWHIGTIKWETKIDILGWRDRGSNTWPLASRVGALSITLHLIHELIRWFHKNSI